MRLFLAILTTGLSVALPAQGVVAPVQLGQINPVPGLDAGGVPGTRVMHVHMIHLPGSPPNVFYCAATVEGLGGWPNLGPAGGWDFVCGDYDVLTDTFTPNAEAAALNGPANEYGLSMHHSGLFAVFTDGSGNVKLASRIATGQPWQLQGNVGLCPCGGNSGYYPALADYQGQPHMLFNRGLSISMAPISLFGSFITGPDVPIVDVPAGMFVATSATPIIDPTGELIGVSHSAYDGQIGSVDHYLSLDLDPSTPAVLLNDAATHTWANAFIGGRFFDNEANYPARHTMAIDTVWFTGGRALAGGTMHVRMLSPPTTGPQAWLSFFAASTAFLPAGMPIPSIQGLLGIDAATAWVSGPYLHDNRNGEVAASFPIPNTPGLAGVRLPAQSASLEATSGTAYLNNTAAFVVE